MKILKISFGMKYFTHRWLQSGYFFFQIRAYFSSFWKRAGETSPLSSYASVPKEKHVSFKQVSLLTNWITKSRKNFNLGTTATRNQFANSLLSKKLQRGNQEVFLVIFTKLVEKIPLYDQDTTEQNVTKNITMKNLKICFW